MPTFDQNAFNQFVIAKNIYGFFDKPLTLKSGRQSHFYANFRTVVADVWLAEKLARFVIDFVETNNIPVDTFYGVPEGATKLGVLTQYLWASQQKGFEAGSHALAMGRAKPKEHGDPKDKYFAGLPKGKTVVLEDVTTTGGSLIKTLDFLKDSGVEISAVLSLTNRMEKRDDGLSVEEAVNNLGLKFYSLSEATELLPLAVNEYDPPRNVVTELIAEFVRYGVKALHLP